MVITSTQWYNLGVQMGEVDKCIIRLMYILYGIYGENNKYTKLLFGVHRNALCALQSNLATQVSISYPLDVHILPGYEHVSITRLFYNINRYTVEEVNNIITNVKDIRPLPEKLTLSEIADFKISMSYIKAFISRIDCFFFEGKNVHVRDMKKALIKLESFLRPMPYCESSSQEKEIKEEHLQKNVNRKRRVVMIIEGKLTCFLTEKPL